MPYRGALVNLVAEERQDVGFVMRQVTDDLGMREAEIVLAGERSSDEFALMVRIPPDRSFECRAFRHRAFR